MVDYILIGFGFAGASLAYRLEERGRSFIVLDKNQHRASSVAAGLMNPVNLKRLSLAWKGDLHLDEAKGFYSRLESHLGELFLQPLEIYRIFTSVEEQNDWFTAADKPRLSRFLDPRIVRQLGPEIQAEYGFGRLRETSRLNSVLFLETYMKYLKAKGKFRTGSLSYSEVEFTDQGIRYGDLEGRRLVFCEGMGIRSNPFFNFLPVTGNKGEYLIIKAPGLHLTTAVKAGIFLIPVKDDNYAVGASYSHHDKVNGPTSQAREELLLKLRKFLTADFELVDQLAGIRPVTPDRRPVTGRHPAHENLYCLNGLGSRGILMSPYISRQLLDHIENGDPLDPEIALERFIKKYYRE